MVLNQSVFKGRKSGIRNLIKTWFHGTNARVLYAANEVIYAILEIALC